MLDSNRSPSNSLDTILYKLFVGGNQQKAHPVVMFVSPDCRSHALKFTEAVGARLALASKEKVAVAGCDTLARYRGDPQSIRKSVVESAGSSKAHMSIENGQGEEGPSRWLEAGFGAACVLALRQEFAYTLLYCDFSTCSNEFLWIAALVDELVIVVTADVTTKEQIGQLLRFSEVAKANIAGFALVGEN